MKVSQNKQVFVVGGEQGIEGGWRFVFIRNLTLILLLLAAWLWTHPYEGVVHDSLLYVVQALSRIHTNLADNDLLLQYGEQSKFTLFDNVLAEGIRSSGINAATITFLVIGQLLWVAAAAILAKQSVSGRAWWIFLALLFSLSSYYGPFEILSYGERFLTPRLYAEAIVMLAIASMVAGRNLAAVLLILLCVPVHPLVALSGALYLAFYEVMGRWQTWHLAAAALGALLLFVVTYLGISPFDRLMQTMDDAWLDTVVLRTPWVLVSEWDAEAFGKILFDLSLLAFAASVHHGVYGRLFRSGVWVGVFGVGLTLIAGDLFHNQLVIQLQPWRCLWITHWFVYLAAVLLITSDMGKDRHGKSVLLAFLVAWLSPGPVGGVIAVLTAVAYRTGYSRRISELDPRFLRLLLLPAGIIVAGWLMTRLIESFMTWNELDSESLYLFPHKLAALFSVIFPLFVWLVWKPGVRHRWRVQVPVLFLAIFLLSGSILFWDQRLPQRLMIERGEVSTRALFGVDIPEDSRVYWRGGAELTWLGLYRASYWNIRQGAAIPFSQQLATSYRERLERLAVMGEVGFHPKTGHADVNQSILVGGVKPEGLVSVCKDPMLDWVILSEKMWPLDHVAYSDTALGEYYLYDCGKLRRASDWPVTNDRGERARGKT